MLSGVFAMPAFVLLLLALMLQTRQLMMQGEELKLTREELSASRQALETQANFAMKQFTIKEEELEDKAFVEGVKNTANLVKGLGKVIMLHSVVNQSKEIRLDLSYNESESDAILRGLSSALRDGSQKGEGYKYNRINRLIEIADSVNELISAKERLSMPGNIAARRYGLEELKINLKNFIAVVANDSI